MSDYLSLQIAWPEILRLLNEFWALFQFAIIGFVGSIVVSMIRKDKFTSIWERLQTYVPGAVISFFLTPWLIEYFAVQEKYSGVIGFLVGCLSVDIAKALLRGFQELRLGQLVSEIVKARFGVSSSKSEKGGRHGRRND